MRPRSWIILGIGALAAIPAICAFAAIFGDPINHANFAMIKEGITEAGVVQILGRAPDETEITNDLCFDKSCTKFAAGRSVRKLTWHGSQMDIELAFHDSGIVHLPYCRVQEHDTTIRRLRRWLGIDPPEFLTKSCYMNTTDTLPD